MWLWDKEHNAFTSSIFSCTIPLLQQDVEMHVETGYV